jgi:hypothetical protein
MGDRDPARRRPRPLALLAGVFVAVLASACGGPVGTVEADGTTYEITDVEAGQIDVTACQGAECTIERDGVLFSKRSILVVMEPDDEIADAGEVRGSTLSTGCRDGKVFVRDESQGYGCTSFNVSTQDSDAGSKVALVFSGDCRDCPDDGFTGDLELVVPGNDPVKLD